MPTGPGCAGTRAAGAPDTIANTQRAITRIPPPKGAYKNIYGLSKALMKRDPVRIAAELRLFIVNAIAESLQRNGIQVLIVSLDAKHLHILARFPDHKPRHWIGLAKKHASHLVRQHGMRTDDGGLWAKRSRALPISDRRHQVRVFCYILDHCNRGARVWRFDRAECKSSS